MLTLSTPIQNLIGIGSILQRRLKKLGIKTIGDLLFHFPHRYDDFSNLVPINKVKLDQNCTIRGKILEIENTIAWKRRLSITTALVQDDTGAIKATWFNQPYLTKTLQKDDDVFLSGKITFNKQGIYISNPLYEKADPQKFLTRTAGLIAVYPETQGLSSKWLRSIIKKVLAQLNNELPETLPAKILKENNFLPINKALWQIHFPDTLKLAAEAKRRFSFEELFYIELFVLRERLKLSKEKASAIPLKLEVVKEFVESLPFKLTDDQRKSAWQILKDLEKPRPMNRLLQGDVGSGKTVVAAVAALNVIKAGYQVAFMAPTEILAKQHFQTVFNALKDFKVGIGLLTGKEDKYYSRKLKNEIIEASKNKIIKMIQGEINSYTGKLDVKLNILIGTHALIQDKVKFGKLALVVVDEQHRFGVEQRAKLCCQNTQKEIPHLLSMTATPIPRTLALTVYGDLDLSLISQMPKGRKKIITRVIEPKERAGAYQFIRKEVKKGRQVFVICPRIEAKSNEQKTKNKDLTGWLASNASPARNAVSTAGWSDAGWSETKAVKEEYEKLSKEIFPDLKIGILHGKMTGKEKEKAMSAFARPKTNYGGSVLSPTKSRSVGGKNRIDILVSTSVVEVGIDVPNATVMLIEGADRFGLAQLHQFRGRVGRSKYQSYCFLLTESTSKITKARLKALITCDDGFKLAEKDLEIRGPGDLSGTRQWGIPDLTMDSLKDLPLVEKTRQEAKDILQEDPELKKYPNLQNKLRMFREKIHLE
ncbi:ATP-dependent DNA helicase RecG [Patescibacteria group bacterium]|nr:ATP-dependent DNA helicase RecG [Patescibacteria group bacterium]